MQDRPWIGSQYTDGINGKKIVLIGNSSSSDDDAAVNDESTIVLVSKIMTKEWHASFFDHLRNYVGELDHVDLWPKVIFFNYAPRAVGTGEDRYRQLNSEEADEAKARLLAVIGEHKPDKVIVFSKRIRWALPPLDNREEFGPEGSGFEKGTLQAGGHSAEVYLLQHPQGAVKNVMIASVRDAIGV